MLNEHEDSFQKPIRVDNLGPIFISCSDDVEGLLTVVKVRENALPALKHPLISRERKSITKHPRLL